MTFKAKLRKVGNSLGVLIPKEVITHLEDEWGVNVITAGDSIYLDVITKDIEHADTPCGVLPLVPENSVPHPSQMKTGRMVFNYNKGVYERK